MDFEEVVRRVAVPGGMTELAITILSRHMPHAWQEVFQETARREMEARKSLALRGAYSGEGER